MKLNYKDSALISSDDLNKYEEILAPYLGHMQEVAERGTYDYDEASINCSFDERVVAQVEELVEQKVSDNLKYIVVIGIGGSNLGTKSIYDALVGHIDQFTADRYPKMFFLDTNNSTYLDALADFLIKNVQNSEDILFVSISKSGGTAETIANTEMMLGFLKEKFERISERLVVITDYGSNFWEAAKGKGVAHLAIPKLVGGRYSVLSAVGLFPLAAAGFDIKALLAGAQEMRKICIESLNENNPAFVSASILFHHYKNKKSIHDTFVFNAELESVSRWYRQLTGESIGKEKDVNGKIVHAGMTPTSSVGSVDLHSVGQLYLGGPLDKVTTFVVSAKTSERPQVPTERFFEGLVDMVTGKKASDIMTAIIEGVKIAYTKKELPFMEIVLDDISEKSLGGLLQFKMIEMMYLGKLMQVNPFDQPNVESYKIETKQILEAN